MTKKTKNIVRALKKRFETLYGALEDEEDKEEWMKLLKILESEQL